MQLCNYADDNTTYFLNNNSNIVLSRLRHDFVIILEWLYENYMVLNSDKCYFLTLDFNKPFPDFSFENTITKSVTKEKIFGIVNENYLNLKFQMKKTCEKSQPKTHCTCKNFKINISY